VNVGSGAGPIFVSTLPEDEESIRGPLVEPWALLRDEGEGGGRSAMDALARLASTYRRVGVVLV
jgi:hypothetical protein